MVNVLFFGFKYVLMDILIINNLAKYDEKERHFFSLMCRLIWRFLQRLEAKLPLEFCQPQPERVSGHDTSTF